MNIRQTHTYAVLEVSHAAFVEIAAKLRQAGYNHAFQPEDGKLLIDMNGIALVSEKDVQKPVKSRRQVRLLTFVN